MRSLRPTVSVLAALLLGGCSTHEVRFEADVPPPPLSSEERAASAHEVVTTLVRRFGSGRPPPAATAALAEAAMLDHVATGSEESRRAAHRLARSLMRDRIPVGRGLAQRSSTANRPDATATIEAARTWLVLDQVKRDPDYRSAATRAAQALVTPRMGWTGVPGGYALREAGSGRLGIALTAQAGLFLTKYALLGGGKLAERYADGTLRVVREAQIGPGRWHDALGTAAPMPVADWARTLYSLHSSPHRPSQLTARRVLPALFAMTFHPWGQPRKGPLVGARGIGPALALRTLQLEPGSRISEYAIRWAMEHRRDDGTFEDAAADDAVAQAYYALAFSFRVFIFSKGALP